MSDPSCKGLRERTAELPRQLIKVPHLLRFVGDEFRKWRLRAIVFGHRLLRGCAATLLLLAFAGLGGCAAPRALASDFPKWEYERLKFASRSLEQAHAECRFELSKIVRLEPIDYVTTKSLSFPRYDALFRPCMEAKGYRVTTSGTRIVCFERCDLLTVPFVKAHPDGSFPL